jgi:hypothetical protein
MLVAVNISFLTLITFHNHFDSENGFSLHIQTDEQEVL